MQYDTSTLPIGRLFTAPLQDAPKSIGFFELQVEVNARLFLADADKRGLALRTVSMYLANSIMETKVPQEYWNIEFNLGMQREFNFPEAASFKALF